jgi:fatty-acyl-CoA synthase
MESGIQEVPLNIAHIFQRAETTFSRRRVISLQESRDVEVSFADWALRVRRLITALDALGVKAGESVATFCWNTQAHLELYYALPCSGRVIHPVNVRLFRDEIEYVLRDAPDVAIFVNRSLLATCMPAVADIIDLRHVVVIEDGSDAAIPDDSRIVLYEELLAAQAPFSGDLPVIDETAAAALWHTSGTTGRPKGVVYSQRAIVLHAMSLLMTDSLGLGERDTVMPVVPMFHVGAWGTPYGALFAGSNFVLVGSDLRGEVLAAALERQRVTVCLAVPTVWRSMLPTIERHDVSNLRLPLCGGSSASAELMREWDEKTGTTMVHAWGMTETGPVTAMSKVRSYHADRSPEEIMHVRTAQGTSVPLVETRIVDFDTGEVLVTDGTTSGELQVRGPWIAGAYHGGAGTDSFTDDGWLRTGDIGTIDAEGYIRLVDRAKDMIKSGGEWISSVGLENAIMAHPLVLEAAVIGVPDERWDERPLACVVLRSADSVSVEDLQEFLRERVVSWWVPERIAFLEALPKTGVGKFSKRMLRQMYADGEVIFAS